MKLDKTQPLYILYGCNIVKERSTMRLVAATTDEEMLKVIIRVQQHGSCAAEIHFTFTLQT